MKKVTIKEVAREAGVSITIASFAINNVKGRVSEEVRKKVLECADRLGYVPNTFAKNLKNRSSNTIALVYDETFLDERNSSTLQLVAAAVKHAGKKGRDILIKLYNPEDKKRSYFDEYIELYKSGRVDGLVFCHITPEIRVLEKMSEEHVNYVIIPSNVRTEGFNMIYIDNYSAMKQGVQYLNDKGYTEIYYLVQKNSEKHSRELGFEAAIKELSIRGRVLYYSSRFRGKGEVWEAIKEVVEGRKGRIAIACWNDVDAINVVDILHSQGIRIPESVGIIGFDDIPASENTYPPLTTIQQPFSEMARAAIDKILESSNEVVDIRIPCTLIERDSI